MNKLNVTQRDYEKLKDIMKLKNILRVESHLRTDDSNKEIQRLSYVLQLFTFFDNTESLQLISKRLELKSLMDGQTLFDADHDKRYLYIVLIGHINVFEELHNDVTNTTIEKRIKFYKSGTYFSFDTLQEFHSQKLIVRANEDTDLVYLTKSLYDYLLQHSHDTSVSHVMKFLRELPVFEPLHSKDLLELSQRISITKIEANTLMIRQGDYPGYCYVVLSGELKVIRRMHNQQLAYKDFEQYSRKQFESAMNGVSSKQVFDIQANTVYQAKDLSKRFSSSNDNYFISVEDVKLYEVAELRRGDLFCFNALLENKPIQYSVVSTMSCQLVRIDRLDLLKYDNQLNIQPTEEQYTQDGKLQQQLDVDSKWNKFKRIQCEQVQKEKMYRKQRFEGLLRTNYNLNFKRHVDYIKDDQIQRRPYMHKSLPPIPQVQTSKTTAPSRRAGLINMSVLN